MRARQKAFLAAAIGFERQFRTLFGDRPATVAQQSLHDRVRRSLSWMKRAAQLSEDDRPPRFLDLWISLNALYAASRGASDDQAVLEAIRDDKDDDKELEDFLDFLDQLVLIKSAEEVMRRFIGKKHILGRTRALVTNPYLWNEFWNRKFSLYEERQKSALKAFDMACRAGHTREFLRHLFCRLRVLRNQIAHGCASATTRRNRDALIPGILLLEEFMLLVIGLLIEHGLGHEWSLVPYPGSRSPQAVVYDKYLGKQR